MQLLPIRPGFGRTERHLHGEGFLLARLAPPLGAPGLGRRVVRAGVEPAGQAWVIREPCRLARQRGENALRHVLRALHIAVHLPQCCRVDEVDLPAHQLGEGIFGPVASVAAEEVGVIRHGFHSITAAPGKSGQKYPELKVGRLTEGGAH